MKRLTLLKWAVVLILTIAMAPGTAPAQEDDTVTISGLFNMDYLYGTVGDDLAEVYANGYDHAWTLTLHGTSQTHEHFSWGELFQTTIHAQSFDFEFFGPDADLLNGFVSDNLAGGEVLIELYNSYSRGEAYFYVDVDGPEVSFWTGIDIADFGSTTLFPADANGYPVVSPEPFSIEPDYTTLGYGYFQGTGGIGSNAGPVTFVGGVGDPPPPTSLPTLYIHDGAALEGKRGTTNLKLTVTLSPSSASTVTVNYATDDGTAVAKSDYYATSGTLTFQPGQTSQTISISVKGDRKREPNEFFYVDLFAPDGATITDGTATATILNDD